jgi:hypothetical protein
LYGTQNGDSESRLECPAIFQLCAEWAFSLPFLIAFTRFLKGGFCCAMARGKRAEMEIDVVDL